MLVTTLRYTIITMTHLKHIIDNLALISDLGYASVSLAMLDGEGLLVLAARRTATAIGPEVVNRIGTHLPLDWPKPLTIDGPEIAPEDDFEHEAAQAAAFAVPVRGTRERTRVNPNDSTLITYRTFADPIFDASGSVVAVLLRDVASRQLKAPGRMELEFMKMTDELVKGLSRGPLLDQEGAEFHTARRPGDGVLRIDNQGIIAYPSPNAVAILRTAGFEDRVRTAHASELPGGGFAIMGVLGRFSALSLEIVVAGRTLLYRTIGIDSGAVVLVEDVTELRAEQRLVQAKEATIREVHHRVKNNLQTVAALLRMQARRATNSETKDALSEATARVNSMAAVHELLSERTLESLDFKTVAERVVTLTLASMAEMDKRVDVAIEAGPAPELDSSVATTLAMVLTELLYNAFEHGGPHISLDFEAHDGRFFLNLSDDGPGFPIDFDSKRDSNLGLAIAQTLITQDLGGTLEFFNQAGACVAIDIPLQKRSNSCE